MARHLPADGAVCRGSHLSAGSATAAAQAESQWAGHAGRQHGADDLPCGGSGIDSVKFCDAGTRRYHLDGYPERRGTCAEAAALPQAWGYPRSGNRRYWRVAQPCRLKPNEPQRFPAMSNLHRVMAVALVLLSPLAASAHGWPAYSHSLTVAYYPAVTLVAYQPYPILVAPPLLVCPPPAVVSALPPAAPYARPTPAPPSASPSSAAPPLV